MAETDRYLLTQGLRQNFPTFIHRTFLTVDPGTKYLRNWHIEAIAHHLQMCAEGKIKRLIITVPPRHLKSICASVALPAWILGHDPTKQVICICYSQELTDKFTGQFRAVITSDWYRSAFPNTRPAKNIETEYATTKGGFRYATSVGGTLTGRGGNFIIIDDPIKPEEAMSKTSREKAISWYRTTLTTRLNNKNDDVIILIMQRLHMDDLAGHLLENEPGDWTHLDLPAIASEHQKIPIGNGEFHHREKGDVLHHERESRDSLDKIKASLGSEIFSAQYLQSPVSEEGNMIKRDWLRFYDALPDRGPNDRIIQSWDTAMKPEERNDPSVCTTWLEKGELYYLMDVTRERVDFPGLKGLVIDLNRRFQADVVIIEDKTSGTSLIQDLNGEGSLHPIAFKPEGDKIMRMHAECAKIEAGRVLLPREATWLDTFLSEILAFPGSRHDDQVDSLSQFLNWVGKGQENYFRYEFIDPYEDAIPSPDQFIRNR